jgi:tetratricopeptide (TPR) repeat protein
MFFSRFLSTNHYETSNQKLRWVRRMASPPWKNIYNLSDGQLMLLDEAENAIEKMDLSKAESILLKMNDESPNCVPILNVLAHMYGRHLSDFESAVEFYAQVLEIEPDNAWARDERRKYSRYLSYD